MHFKCPKVAIKMPKMAFKFYEMDLQIDLIPKYVQTLALSSKIISFSAKMAYGQTLVFGKGFSVVEWSNALHTGSGGPWF